MLGKKQLSEERVREILMTCYDPEIPVNIVDLGLIYGIAVEDGDVKIKMTLTALGCPLSPFIKEDIERRMKNAEKVKNVQIEIVWDPPWSPEKMSKVAHDILGI